MVKTMPSSLLPLVFMMMISFITWNSDLVPSIQVLYSSNSIKFTPYTYDTSYL